MNRNGIVCTGLLASLWEFPSVPVDSSWSNATMKKGLSENLDLYFHGQSVTHSCLDHIGQVSSNCYIVMLCCWKQY